MKPNANFNIHTGNNGTSSNNEQRNIAALAVIGGIISTVGGVISTYASILALQELQQPLDDALSNEELQQPPGNTMSNEDRINELEKQIQYLTKEMNKQKMTENKLY